MNYFRQTYSSGRFSSVVASWLIWEPLQARVWLKDLAQPAPKAAAKAAAATAEPKGAAKTKAAAKKEGKA